MTRWYDFRVTVNNQPIEQHGTRKPLAIIQWDVLYELQMARKHFNISVQDYENMPGTAIWCTGNQMTKSELLALFRLENRTEAVTQDIHARHLERKSKSRR